MFSFAHKGTVLGFATIYGHKPTFIYEEVSLSFWNLLCISICCTSIGVFIFSFLKLFSIPNYYIDNGQVALHYVNLMASEAQ